MRSVERSSPRVRNLTESREKESRAALERVRRDSETVGGSSIARAARRAGDHFSGRDAVGEGEGGTTDSVEVWGRRIGRALSAVLFVLLVAWLGIQLGWW
jgi:hypothetical protein